MPQYRVLKIDNSLRGEKVEPILVTEYKPNATKFAKHLSEELVPGHRISYLVVKEIVTFQSGTKR